MTASEQETDDLIQGVASGKYEIGAAHHGVRVPAIQTTPEFEQVIEGEYNRFGGLTITGLKNAQDYLLTRTNDPHTRGIILRSKRLETLRGIAYNLRFRESST